MTGRAESTEHEDRQQQGAGGGGGPGKGRGCEPKDKRRGWSRRARLGVALAGVYGIIGFAFFVQCSPARLGSGKALGPGQSGQADAEWPAGGELGKQVDFYPGSPAPTQAQNDATSKNGQPPSQKQAVQPVLDATFCEGLAYGECMTLIIQIPAAHLQRSTGLAVLNLIQAAPQWRGLFERACEEGMAVGMPQAARSGPGRQRVLGKLKRSRCVLQSLVDESTPLPKLAAHEFGFKVRLVDFGVTSSETSTAPALGRLSFERTRMELKFHDAQVFGQDSWQPVRGAWNLWNLSNYSGAFTTVHAGIRFGERLDFSLNGQGTAAYLKSLLLPIFDAAVSGRGLGQMGAELVVVREAVAALAAGSNPVVPAIILLAVAADAVRDLCALEESDCRISARASEHGSEVLSTSGASAIVTSQTRAQITDGLKLVPFTIVQGLFRNANLGELERSLSLPTRPFWVGNP